MKAMIFAAGRGTRLGEITGTMPKALVDINGRSALRIAVEKCSAHGFKDLIVNVHHFPEMVEEEIEKLRKEGHSIAVSDERDELLETGGGLYKARDFFDTDPFLLYNVDIITDLDLNSLYDFHMEKRGIATLAARHRKGNRFFLSDDEGRLRGWRNRATGEEIIIERTHVLNEVGFSGIHVVDPAIFKFMEEGVYSLTPFYLKIAKEQKIYTYVDDSGYWTDVGTVETLELARKLSRH